MSNKKDNELTLPSSMVPSIDKGITAEQMGHVVNYKMAQVEQDLEERQDKLKEKREEIEKEKEELDLKFKDIFEKELKDKIKDLKKSAEKINSKADWEVGQRLDQGEDYMWGPYGGRWRREGESSTTLEDQDGINKFLRNNELTFITSRYSEERITLSARAKVDGEEIMVSKAFKFEGKGADKLLERKRELADERDDLNSDIYKLSNLLQNTVKMERQLKAEISKQTIKASPNGEQVIADLEKFKLPAVENVLNNLKF